MCDSCNSLGVPRYGGWNNESVAAKLEEGMLQREGAREKGISERLLQQCSKIRMPVTVRMEQLKLQQI